MSISSGSVHERGFAQLRTQTLAEEAPQRFDYSNMVREIRENFNTRETYSYEYRMGQLGQLRLLMENHSSEMIAAVNQDLGRPPTEGFLGEVLSVMLELDHAEANLKSWMANQTVSTPITLQPGQSKVHQQPKGVVLVIGAWNFPFYLALGPMICAIAAGNAVVLKPSEMSVACEKLMYEVFPKYLDKRFFRVVKGAALETTALLKERWDHILYTGNGAIGRVILRAAAEHLTPVTLELGGKSPAYVDADADISTSARRILNGKCLNAGQVCLAPDYVLVHNSVKDQFVNDLKGHVKSFFGPEVIKSDSFGRIVNERHFDRIAAMLTENHGGKVVEGGLQSANRKEKFIPPTVVVDPSTTSRLMTEEIFGPILPVIGVNSIQDALKIINNMDQSLGTYIFTSDPKKVEEYIKKTESGGTCVNDTAYHVFNPNMPFGGKGSSGMGAYHGKRGFDEFSHFRSTLEHYTWLDPSKRYPPYDKNDVQMLTKLFVGPLLSPQQKMALKMIVGAGVLGVALKASL